jgi:hypothetical protein
MDLSILESSSHSYSLSIDKLQMSTLKVQLHNCHMLKVVNISSWNQTRYTKSCKNYEVQLCP